MPNTTPLGRQRAIVAAAFFVQGLLFISLTTRLPVISQRFDLTELVLSGLMLMMVLLAGAGSVLAERISIQRSSATVVRLALGLLAVGVALMGLGVRPGSGLALFVAGLAVYGLGVGTMDAASNMQAVGVEHAAGRTLLPSFHAAWTFGGIVATVLALATGDALGWLGALLLAGCALVLLALPFPRWHAPPPSADTESVGIPWRPILMIGLALVVFYMVDTATTAWGPLYLASDKVFDDPASSAGLYALATLPYLVATLLARVVGDDATSRFGPVSVVRAAALATAAGLAVVVFAPTWPVAVLGFFVVGLGISVVAPLSFSAAGRLAGEVDPALRQRRIDAVIARFNQFNYVGALLGSVLTGAIGKDNLRIGYAVPLVLVFALLPLARHFAAPREPAAA